MQHFRKGFLEKARCGPCTSFWRPRSAAKPARSGAGLCRLGFHSGMRGAGGPLVAWSRLWTLTFSRIESEAGGLGGLRGVRKEMRVGEKQEPEGEIEGPVGSGQERSPGGRRGGAWEARAATSRADSESAHPEGVSSIISFPGVG